MVLGKKVAIFDWEWGRDRQKIPCYVAWQFFSNLLYPFYILNAVQPNANYLAERKL